MVTVLPINCLGADCLDCRTRRKDRARCVWRWYDPCTLGMITVLFLFVVSVIQLPDEEEGSCSMCVAACGRHPPQKSKNQATRTYTPIPLGKHPRPGSIRRGTGGMRGLCHNDSDFSYDKKDDTSHTTTNDSIRFDDDGLGFSSTRVPVLTSTTIWPGHTGILPPPQAPNTNAIPPSPSSHPAPHNTKQIILLLLLLPIDRHERWAMNEEEE